MSAGLFPLLTGREPPFEADLKRLQFPYTADREGAYVAPASTVLVPSVVVEGDDLFATLLTHLRRRYPEVYGLGVDTARAHERRDTPLKEGEVLSGGATVQLRSLIEFVFFVGDFLLPGDAPAEHFRRATQIVLTLDNQKNAIRAKNVSHFRSKSAST